MSLDDEKRKLLHDLQLVVKQVSGRELRVRELIAFFLVSDLMDISVRSDSGAGMN